MKPSAPRVLILGGTAEARALASALVDRQISVTSSLAGRVSRPRLPAGEVRIGGFGGVEGLTKALREGGWTHLVDATHPFASTMTAHATSAAEATGLPLLRLARPGWSEHPGSDRWHWVASYEQARETAAKLGSHPFITTGRQTLEHFHRWTDRPVLARIVEPLEEAPPPSWTIVHDRGPYSLDGELSVMSGYGIDVLLTKDSGGTYTASKLDAAAKLNIPVVVVARPETIEPERQVGTVDEVLDWLA